MGHGKSTISRQEGFGLLQSEILTGYTSVSVYHFGYVIEFYQHCVSTFSAPLTFEMHILVMTLVCILSLFVTSISQKVP